MTGAVFQRSGASCFVCFVEMHQLVILMQRTVKGAACIANSQLRFLRANGCCVRHNKASCSLCRLYQGEVKRTTRKTNENCRMTLSRQMMLHPRLQQASSQQ